jgi:DNA-binding HxlR family transcriptional regulator
MKVMTRVGRTKRVFSCPVEAAQDVIGGKWKPIILWHLHATKGPCRFGMLRRAIPNATEKMIVQQLRELESTGIVRRRVFREVPPRVEYSLTEEGKDLREALEDVCKWGERYARRIGAVIRNNLPHDVDRSR